ncbi:MAG: PadR family transcriptional regulator, partial [Mycobacterium sp.]
MNDPFEGPDHGPQAEAFGFDPFSPRSRAVHDARSDGRREMRTHAGAGGFGFKPGGPAGFGFGPGFG